MGGGNEPGVFGPNMIGGIAAIVFGLVAAVVVPGLGFVIAIILLLVGIGLIVSAVAAARRRAPTPRP